ncbi:MAG: hypothetical protein ACYTCU_10635 [Planctomycetota bacterium]
MNLRSLLTWCTIWGVAFGVLEGAVVVYLREIFYPDGFSFPLREFPTDLLRTEVVREAATIVMLVAVARLAVQGGLRRFAVFAFLFGVWDIVYYLALLAFVGWPAGPMTWDVLFLIPAPWLSPVLAPVLVSVALIGAAVAILAEPDERRHEVLRPIDWVIETVAGLVIIWSFLWNQSVIAAGAVPTDYPWWLFLIGLGAGVGWFAWRWSRRWVLS